MFYLSARAREKHLHVRLMHKAGDSGVWHSAFQKCFVILLKAGWLWRPKA